MPWCFHQINKLRGNRFSVVVEPSSRQLAVDFVWAFGFAKPALFPEFLDGAGGLALDFYEIISEKTDLSVADESKFLGKNVNTRNMF